MFQRCSHIFLYFLQYFGDKYGVRGSIFGNIFGRSKHVPKSIAIDQELLISHFGIITPLKPYNYIKKPRKTKTRFLFAILFALLDLVLVHYRQLIAHHTDSPRQVIHVCSKLIFGFRMSYPGIIFGKS